MKAAEIAAKAAEIVSGDRENTHGPKRLNHEKICAMWNAYLGIRRAKDWPLEARDVAIMMLLLKVARMELGEVNPDDFVDCIGYAAIAGELDTEPVTDLPLGYGL